MKTCDKCGGTDIKIIRTDTTDYEACCDCLRKELQELETKMSRQAIDTSGHSE